MSDKFSALLTRWRKAPKAPVCRHCGASIPPRKGEGTCHHCDPDGVKRNPLLHKGCE